MAGNSSNSTPREPRPEDFLDERGVFDGQAYCMAQVAYRGRHAYAPALKAAHEFARRRREELGMPTPLRRSQR